MNFFDVCKKHLTRGTDHVLDILFPPICLSCASPIKKQKQLLCDRCMGMISLNDALVCPQCNARIPTHTMHCHPTPYVLAPASAYHDPIPALIHHFKYSRMTAITQFLSAVLIAYAKHINLPIKESTITWVPLHPKKKRSRGFNQSRLLAETLAHYFNASSQAMVIKRTDHLPQARMYSQQKRWDNIKGTFKLIPGSSIPKTVIIVDDVSTSGATLSEIAKILKSAGARNIIGLVVAHA